MLSLQGKWWLGENGPNASLPMVAGGDQRVDLPDSSVDELAAAHRLALWQLAMRIVR